MRNLTLVWVNWKTKMRLKISKFKVFKLTQKIKRKWRSFHCGKIPGKTMILWWILQFNSSISFNVGNKRTCWNLERLPWSFNKLMHQIKRKVVFYLELFYFTISLKEVNSCRVWCMNGMSASIEWFCGEKNFCILEWDGWVMTGYKRGASPLFQSVWLVGVSFFFIVWLDL